MANRDLLGNWLGRVMGSGAIVVSRVSACTRESGNSLIDAVTCPDVSDSSRSVTLRLVNESEGDNSKLIMLTFERLIRNFTLILPQIPRVLLHPKDL